MEQDSPAYSSLGKLIVFILSDVQSYRNKVEYERDASNAHQRGQVRLILHIHLHEKKGPDVQNIRPVKMMPIFSQLLFKACHQFAFLDMFQRDIFARMSQKVTCPQTQCSAQ